MQPWYLSAWSAFWQTYLILLITYPRTPIKRCQSNTAVSCMWMMRMLRDIVPPPASYSNDGWSSLSRSRLPCSEPNTLVKCNSTAPRDSVLLFADCQTTLCVPTQRPSVILEKLLIDKRRSSHNSWHVQRIREDKIIMFLKGCVKEKVLPIVGAW